ncbi:MAG: translation initiation factor IF-2 [Proteobacteria bacterium]|nr:translation initiation factor IF-2 [Pseudomonadota bacterium]
MTATDEQDRKKMLSLSRPGRLELKKTVETGQVRQSFPHGRSKTVTVEVKRKRTFAPGAGGRMAEVKEAAAALEIAVEARPPEVQVDEAAQPAAPRGAPVRTLTAEERAARARAVEAAHRAEEAAKHIDGDVLTQDLPHTDAEMPAVEEPEFEALTETLTEPQPEPPAKVEAAAAAPAVAEAPAAPAPEPARPLPSKAKPGKTAAEEEEEDSAKARKPGRLEARKPSPGATRRQEPRRRAGKLTIQQALDEEERVRSLASVRRAREREKQRAQQTRAEGQKVIREVVVPETITVQELANRMAERSADVIKALMRMGVMATINQIVDADTADLLVQEFGHKIKRVSESDVLIGLTGAADQPEVLLTRAAVVTVMGHVDHGKTSLLDVLRHTDVAAHEAGGITQHIGAYSVELDTGERITFIDTPGHEAFTSMRARGANVTDIVVLVVAADDGVMPQTIEAINHAKAANVPVIVAVNKVDKPEANPQRVKTDLLQHGLVTEDLGGETLAVEVSAKTGVGLERLKEAIVLQAELLDLKANPNRPGEGAIIEAKLERGRGAVATLLVQNGSIRVGDIFVAGAEWGRVRALIDDKGKSIEVAGPSSPVEVLGLNGTPLAGDEFAVVENEARARDVADFRARRLRDSQAAAAGRGTVEQMMAKAAAGGGAKQFAAVIKSDVQGSLEAIRASLERMSTDEAMVRTLHAAVGGINESDITLAKASGAVIIGFNVRANPQARDLARRDGVEIRYYSIIYDVVDDVKAALSGMLAPTIREKLIGNAAIRQIFEITRVGKVAGCMVTEGMVRRGAKVRLLRDNVVVHEGTLKTLRRFKEEVREVKEGYECGMAFENYNDIQAGDVIECFEVEEVARTL